MCRRDVADLQRVNRRAREAGKAGKHGAHIYAQTGRRMDALQSLEPWTGVVQETNAQVGPETWLVVWIAMGGVVCCVCLAGLCYCARRGQVDVVVTY